jgi:hypothetical protein
MARCGIKRWKLLKTYQKKSDGSIKAEILTLMIDKRVVLSEQPFHHATIYQLLHSDGVLPYTS